MENRPLGPEEQDENTESTGTKKKRGSKLSGYLSALRGKENTDGANSEGADTEKPRRAQRLFARLFPNIVERQHIPDAEHMPQIAQEHEFNHDIWRTVTQFASRGENAPDAPSDETADSVAPPVDVSRAANEAAEVADNPDEAVVATPAESAPQPQRVLTTERVEVPLDPEPEEGVANRTMQPEVPAPVFEREDAMSGILPLERSASDSTETIIERRGGNALPVALVAAEYIGRKRADKKLEARTERKIQSARAEQQGRDELLQKELEQVVAENKRQIDQIKRARAGAGERHEVVRSPEKAVEQRVSPILERQPRVERRTETDSPSISVESIQPQKIAERVADAAEHDVPVERAFERSHEVKDDTAATNTSNGATSVASVVASSAAASNYANLTKVGGAKDDLPFISDEAAKELYKRAAARGFWSAICLIILGAIAYLVVK